MMGTTAIEWTDNRWNPLVGCTEVSPGCRNCYAAGMAHRLAAMAEADLAAGKDPGRKRHYLGTTEKRGGKVVWTGKVNVVPEALADPLGWKKPRRVFVNSMSDLFHADVPFEFIDQVFAVMALCPQHTFQVLTKRPERMAEYFAGLLPRLQKMYVDDDTEAEECLITALSELTNDDKVAASCLGWLNTFNARNMAWPLPNVWLGTSVENQEQADKRIPHLLQTPAAVRFLSCEPLLGAVKIIRTDIEPTCDRCCGDGCDPDIWRLGLGRHPLQMEPDPCKKCNYGHALDWVIVGGESGPNARPCNVEWIRSIVAQCKAAGVPVFTKQMGSLCLDNDGVSRCSWPPLTQFKQTGNECRVLLRDSKGGDMEEFPHDLQVREIPDANA